MARKPSKKKPAPKGLQKGMNGAMEDVCIPNLKLIDGVKVNNKRVENKNCLDGFIPKDSPFS